MKLEVVANYDELSTRAAQLIATELNRQPELVLLAATGTTPSGTYRELEQAYRRGDLDTSRLTLVQLDEYTGLEPDDLRLLYRWMDSTLIAPLGVPPARVLRFQSDGRDAADACRSYVDAVRMQGGIDLAVLGLGPNGHLGFNEPPAAPEATTRVVPLSPASVASNARYWGSRSRVPAHALTAGMDIILAARKILLLVAGAHKADVLRKTVTGPRTDEIPATHLRLASDVTIIADRDAWPG